MKDHPPRRENPRQSSTSGSSTKFLLDPTFEYTWKWFEMHVAHRQTMFRYFLVAAGIFGVVYVRAMPHPVRLFPASIAFAGLLVSCHI